MSELTPSTLPTEADYRRYDRIWRKVSPELDPYPEVRAAQPDVTMEPRPSTLPDAASGDCCMGTAAQTELDAIRGFLRDELADAQTYRYLATAAPTPEGRRLMRRLAADETGHAKTLQSAHFLITGETYPITVVLPPQPRLLWRDRLRGRWHEEACGGVHYARAAEETADVCLKKIFEQLSADEYRHAEWLLRLIEKTL